MLWMPPPGEASIASISHQQRGPVPQAGRNPHRRHRGNGAHGRALLTGGLDRRRPAHPKHHHDHPQPRVPVEYTLIVKATASSSSACCRRPGPGPPWSDPSGEYRHVDPTGERHDHHLHGGVQHARTLPCPNTPDRLSAASPPAVQLLALAGLSMRLTSETRRPPGRLVGGLSGSRNPRLGNVPSTAAAACLWGPWDPWAARRGGTRSRRR
jgi:hypothetical protein